jgi:hypothetical protein
VAVAVVGLAAAAITFASHDRVSGAAAARSGQRSTEVVLDVSGSVGESSSAVAARALTRIGRSGGTVGLVLFSDSAEKALPPGTPAAQLLPFARAFTPRPQRADSPPAYRPPWDSDTNPWHPSFSGGTTISAGLAAAREALESERGGGTVLLISDLGDSLSDFGLVRRELVALDDARIPVRILALPNAAVKDVKWFRKLEGAESFVRPLRPVPSDPTADGPPSSETAFPIAVGLITVLVAFLLAIDELAGRALRWGAST